MISLQNRLTLTYAIFISAALAVLTLAVNRFTGAVFTGLIKNNIAEKSGEIVRAVGDQYNPLNLNFDTASIEAMGMLFVHEGYIVTVQDNRGGIVWDARSCDMEQCAAVITGITERMENEFGLSGALQVQQFPVQYGGRTAGSVTIETYGPFFYTETETQFLASINRVLIAAGIFFTLLSIIVSIPLARTIARPIVRAGKAAREIAKAYGRGPGAQNPGAQPAAVKLDDRYKTRELAELSRAINELSGELEEGERRQRQLVRDIAHELRTPLTCLQGSMEAMIDGVYRADREHLESCHEEIIRLAALVEDLDTLTGLEWQGISLNRTSFELARLLEITAAPFETAARAKGITLTLDLAPGPIHADYDRLKQVIINLLSTAVKYTDAGGITVSAAPAAGRWEISVADTGIVIPEAALPRVFERFYRSDQSRSRGTGGAGIGLAIAAAIVTAHSGSITAAPNPGGGSVFTVRV
jgi:signal transduction histidine kinase